MENLILNSHESLKKLKNNILWLRFRVPQSVAILLNLTLMMKMVYINLFIPFLALTLTSRLTFNIQCLVLRNWNGFKNFIVSFWRYWKGIFKQEPEYRFFKYLQGVSSNFGLNFSAYPGRISNIAGVLSDFTKFSKNISISLDVTLVIGDFLFSGGLFNLSFGIVDDELMCFSMLFFLNWGDLKSILNNISGCRKVPEFEGDT